jgi:uncharacterized protein (DUF1800 family)
MVMARQRALPMLSTALAAACAAHTVRNARPEQVSAFGRVPVPTQAVARHALARFSFGATPAGVEEVKARGVAGWFEHELARGASAARAPNTSPYAHALAEPEDVIAAFGAKEENDPADTEQISLRKQARRVNVKELLATIGSAQVARHVESPAQLHAAMVDFWSNHFNVFARKHTLKVLAGNYVESVIVPHALGRFEELLIATAQSPAMLVYLDNDKSAAPGPRGRRGLNENYARELLELHTLGVDGGYTQTDVIAVARILTGYGLGEPREQGLSFRFSPARHDFGEKTVLGRAFPAGVGEEEGLALLRFLARQPATARHIARKLCQRFIADEPASECVSAIAKTFLDTQGDMTEVLRAILSSSWFWEPGVRGGKLKKPSEFLASALRALGFTLDGTPAIAKESAELGEPALLYPAPTGYPDRVAAWAGGAQILARMDFAARLVAGRVSGVNAQDLAEIFPASANVDALVERVDALIFLGLGSEQTLRVLREEAGRAASAEQARNTALALALGGPEFQRR